MFIPYLDRGVSKFLHLIGKRSLTAVRKQPRAVTVLKALEDGEGITARLRVQDKLEIFEPDEAVIFAVSFLQRYIQLLPLRERWGERRLKIGNVCRDASILREYECLYRSEVLIPLVRSIAKNQQFHLKSITCEIDEDCQVYKMLPKVSRLEVMACEIARLGELEFYESIQAERQRVNRVRTKKAEQRMLETSTVKKRPRFWDWLNNMLNEKGVTPTVADEICSTIDTEWTEQEQLHNSTFNFALKEMKQNIVSEVNLVPAHDKFNLAELHRAQTAKIASLTAENLRLTTQIGKVREEEEQKAIEYYRPLVTAQYTALIKMAARLNIYQLNMHTQLQVRPFTNINLKTKTI